MSTDRARRIILALACIVLPSKAAAQTVLLGAHVRVVDASSNNPLKVGKLVHFVGDTAIILSEANLAAPKTRSVWIVGGQRRLEIRTALRRKTGVGAIVGGVVGAAAGAAIGSGTPPCQPTTEWRRTNARLTGICQ
jgi:hypothetical protein